MEGSSDECYHGVMQAKRHQRMPLATMFGGIGTSLQQPRQHHEFDSSLCDINGFMKKDLKSIGALCLEIIMMKRRPSLSERRNEQREDAEMEK